MTGEEAERIGLVSRCVDDEVVHDTALDVARQLATMSQSALRWTKHVLNHWYRQAEPIFDASLAYEMYGFGGPDAGEGFRAARDRHHPSFDGPTSE
jgi:enoyl-CoA hydratase